MAEISSGRPYVDNGDIREFDVTLSQEEYVWHRDFGDRKIEILSGQGWQLQYEGCLPTLLQEGRCYFIPDMEYHRLIKGESDLIIKMYKY